MTTIGTDRHENVIAGLIGQGMPVVVLAPHLGDAALSCGALLTYAVSRTPITVVTFFTEGGQAPYARSARRYLRQVGARDAEMAYQWRRDEDRAALEPLGITCVHAGLTEALFRRRPANLSRSKLTNVYPFYRVHATSGRIVAADAGMLREVREIIHRVAGSGPAWCWRRWAWAVTWTASWCARPRRAAGARSLTTATSPVAAAIRLPRPLSTVMTWSRRGGPSRPRTRPNWSGPTGA